MSIEIYLHSTDEMKRMPQTRLTHDSAWEKPQMRMYKPKLLDVLKYDTHQTEKRI